MKETNKILTDQTKQDMQRRCENEMCYNCPYLARINISPVPGSKKEFYIDKEGTKTLQCCLAGVLEITEGRLKK